MENKWFEVNYENEKQIIKELQKLEHFIIKSKKQDSVYFEKVSNCATWLTKAGYYKEALKMFQFLQVKHPSEYIINSNLGTLYELNGNNDSALFYI